MTETSFMKARGEFQTGRSEAAAQTYARIAVLTYANFPGALATVARELLVAGYADEAEQVTRFALDNPTRH